MEGGLYAGSYHFRVMTITDRQMQRGRAISVGGQNSGALYGWFASCGFYILQSRGEAYARGGIIAVHDFRQVLRRMSARSCVHNSLSDYGRGCTSQLNFELRYF